MSAGLKIFAIALVSAGGLMAAELTLASGTIAGDTPARLTLSLSGGASELTGLQCEIEYDGGDLNLSVEAGPQAKDARKEVFLSRPSQNTVRLVIAGINQASLGDGVVAVVGLSVRGPAKDGRQHILKITNAAGTTKHAVAVHIISRGDAHVNETR